MALSERAQPSLGPALDGSAEMPAEAPGSADTLASPHVCTDADIADALKLSDAALWNQTRDDWQVFVRHGKTLGLRSSDGTLVATAAALPYGAARGWISMVLVAQDWRHRGLATRLLALCVEHLQQLGATPILDATPAGAATYGKAGFHSGFELARWQGPGAAGERPDDEGIRPANTADLRTMERLDAQANGIERAFLLHDLLARDGGAGWIRTDDSGFVLRRRGGRATQIGPLVAANESAATQLLHTALCSVSGPVFLDLPARWSHLTAWLAQRGFTLQRPFVRMALGPADIAAANDRVFLLAGPEFG